MRPDRDRNTDWPYPGTSDTWIFVDAIITLLTAALTIIVLTVRHPFTVLGFLVLGSVLAAVVGWW